MFFCLNCTLQFLLVLMVLMQKLEEAAMQDSVSIVGNSTIYPEQWTLNSAFFLSITIASTIGEFYCHCCKTLITIKFHNLLNLFFYLQENGQGIMLRVMAKQFS